VIGIGVDAGTKAVRIVEVRGKAGVFRVTRFLERPRKAGASAGETLREAAEEGKLRGKGARVGLTGRDVIYRYLQVPPVPEWQLRNLMKIEVGSLAAQPGGEVAADFNLLPVPRGLGGEDTVLLAVARSAALEELLGALGKSPLKLGSFAPNALALYAAYLHGGDPKGWTLLANLGDENTDVALANGTDLAFARNLAGGGKAFTDAIAQRFNVSAERAERLKVELGNVDPGAKDRYASSQEEKVSHAALSAAGQVHALLQSVPMLARTQAKVAEAKIERVLLSGGGGRLRGLSEYLAASLGVPVAPFDPFGALDVSGLPAGEDAALEASGPAAACALGLALLGADPTAYSLEILPESVRRRRAFARGGAFAIASGVLAGAFLVGDFALTWKDASKYEGNAKVLVAQGKAREKANADAEAVLAETEALGKKGRILEERAQAGAGLVRAHALLQRHLPADLWVTRVALDRKAEAGLKTGEDPRPIVLVEGQGREGASGIEGTFGQFAEALGAEKVSVVTRGAGRVKGAFQFSVELNLFPEGE
jgi:type IV pilus assembly protein PilM